VATTCTENGYRQPNQALQYDQKAATTCKDDAHK